MIEKQKLSDLLASAHEKRTSLYQVLSDEDTNAYRLFHGAAEGFPGLAIDRYGDLILIQSFREPLDAQDRKNIEEALLTLNLSWKYTLAFNHRGPGGNPELTPEALRERTCKEFGAQFWIRARHAGIDPWLFLDLRAGRRFLRTQVNGKSLLNLFSYTCSIGVTAAHANASEVWNVDFSSSALQVGRRNAELNSIDPKRFITIEEDCIPVMRQLAGLNAGGRRNKSRHYQRLEPRQFDFVVLDPPAWSKGSFGAVDVVNDYPTLFKAAVLSAHPGTGTVLATNHVASINCESWFDILKRCAAKAGRPLRSIQKLTPDVDFPSYDGNAPLKIAVCKV